MNRVALFLPNWVGDVVMATPAVRAVRGHFPAAERLWAVARRLRRKRIDTAVLFPNSFRTALLARLGGCRRVVGFARYGRGLLLSRRLRPATDGRGRITPSPVIDDYNRLAVALGTPDPGNRMELFTTGADEAAAGVVWERFGLGRYPRVVGLNPGAAFGAAKHWPAEHFAALARMLTQRLGCGVLVLCGPGERDIARRIAADSRSPHVASLADTPLSLGLTKALVRRLDLLVTTDSGPRHFAAAFGRPVVTLFGPTHIEWTETYYERAVHLQKRVPCGPCQRRVCPLDHRCMRDLGPEEVFDAAAGLLARFPLPLAGEVRRAG